jgi:hypothetical protein
MPPPKATAARSRRLERLAAAVFGDDWRAQIAALMLVDPATVWRWCNGRAPIPEAVFVALECLKREKGK